MGETVAALTSDPPALPALHMEGLEKRFGGVRALRGAHLRVARTGVIHALIGENGSGKSTLLRLLSGQLQPDAGQISLDGRPVHFHNPRAAIERGIATVSQETALAAHLSVAENIFMGHRPQRGALGIKWAETLTRAEGVLASLGLEVDPRRRVGDLRPDQQQLVEIARAVSMDARILILDEPTSSLTEDEVLFLYSVVRRLKKHGVITIFVSHRLPELFELADEITVLRDGATAAAGPISEFDTTSLVAAMVGGSSTHQTAAPRRLREGRGSAEAPRLQLHRVDVPGRAHAVDLEVYPGEILGLAGLVGAGRSELLEAIFGARRHSGGEIVVDGRAVSFGSPREAISAGVGYLPPDRRIRGLVLGRSAADNLVMAQATQRPRRIGPRRAEEALAVEEAIDKLGVKITSSQEPVGRLSGGNQQKVALGKWLVAGCRVLLLDEPTRGVDVAAKDEIHRLLRREADEGAAILVSSSETPELLALCDRLLVMVRGRIVASVDPGASTEFEIAHLAGGAN